MVLRVSGGMPRNVGWLTRSPERSELIEGVEDIVALSLRVMVRVLV